MNLNVFDIHKKKMDVKRTYLFLFIIYDNKIQVDKTNEKKKHTQSSFLNNDDETKNKKSFTFSED